MGFRNFRLNCVVRVVALTATMAVLTYLLLFTDLYVSSAVMALIVVGEVGALVRYVEKSNRDLGRFLLAVRHSDFSQTFPSSNRGAAHEELRLALNAVLQQFRLTRSKGQENFRYLQTVIQHVGIGLIAFSPDGRVDIVNSAAKKILGVNPIQTVNDLAEVSQSLVDSLVSIGSGKKSLVKIVREGELMQLSVHATEFRIGGKTIKLISMQNIASELAEREMEAWQQLVRVLTHEIMNSVTPIASLASTARHLLESPAEENAVADDTGRHHDTATLKDLRSAINTIEKRSDGLVHFVDAYRDLTRIPKPSFQIVSIGELFIRVKQLVRSRPDASGIEITADVSPDSLEVTADPDLVEQVLINLMINAVEVLKGQTEGRIELSAYQNDRGRVIITVTDNGPGISDEAAERLFVPFFTTKAEGTGIGLSLSRQIMRLHKGEVTAGSTHDGRTVFSLRF